MKPRSFTAFLVFAGVSAISLAPVFGASFRALAWNSPISEVFYSPSGDPAKLEPFEAYTHARSDAYQLSEGVGTVRFYRKESQPDGTEKAVEVASANLSKAGQDALVILFDNRQRPGRYFTEVLDDSAASFRGGGFRFVNYTPVPVGVALGDEKARLAPKEAMIINGKPRTIGQVDNVLDVSVFVLADKTPRQVFGNIWAHNPSVRNLVFIVQVPGLQNAYEVKRITDNPAERLEMEARAAKANSSQ